MDKYSVALGVFEELLDALRQKEDPKQEEKDTPEWGSFESAVEFVLAHEGRYANDPVDPGGETHWGISKRSYPHIDIKNLTREEAIEIYRKDWWDKYQYHQIEDITIATKVFDFAVNMGATPAHRLLQRSLHAAGQRHVVIDGIIGPQTLTATNEADPKLVLGAIRAEAAHYYGRLIERNASLKRFEEGWTNRAYA